jgi:hypothetical protein
MDLSSLIDLNPEVKVRRKDTDRLFYDQYHYGIDLCMENISCMRGLDKLPDDYRTEITQRYYQRYQWTYRYHDRHEHVVLHDTQDFERLELLYKLAELLNTHRSEIKLVVSGKYGYVYTNNVQLLLSVITNFSQHVQQLRHACIVRPKNTVSLRNSPHQYRTYFREKSINQTEKQQLLTFLQTQTEWRVSKALLKRLTRSSPMWMSRSYFVDHNTESEVVMLNLIVPGILQMTMPVVEVNK